MKFSTRVMALALTLMLLFATLSITASADNGSGLVSGIGFVHATSLNLRAQPSTGSPILATANSGECVVVLGQEEGWYHVSYNLQEGYMSAEFLTVSTAENAELGYGIVTGSGVNLRSGPDTSYNKVGTASNGDRLYIIGVNNGWYKVLSGSSSCYIRSDYLSLSEIPYENRASNNTPQYFRGGKAIGALPVGSTTQAVTGSQGVNSGYTGSATGAQILAKATEYLGTPYVNGGASPSGFDCSGFVYYVYGTFGIPVGRTPEAQYAAGMVVDKANLQPGDIVLFSGTYAGGISHSGIYAGNGQFIHSPNSRSTVSYSDLTSGYWSEHFYCGVRVV